MADATITAPAAQDDDDHLMDGHASGEHEHRTSTGISHEKLGMWMFLGSECLLFGGLISTYLLYKNRPSIPLPDASDGALVASELQISELFDIVFTSVSSFVLLGSSLTMVFAVLSAARGDKPRLRLWLIATALLGAVFIGGQVYEFTVFVNEGLGFTSNISSSAFFTLTGFHGVHVSLGIVMLLVTLGLTFHHRRNPTPESVEIVGLYWHFVDIVWILIFAVVYLIP